MFFAWWSLDVMAALGVSGGYVPERMLVSLDARARLQPAGDAPHRSRVRSCPALHGSRVNVNEGLKDASQTERGGSAGGGMRRLLIVAELTLSVVLLVGCGLIVQATDGLSANVDGFMPRIDCSRPDRTPVATLPPRFRNGGPPGARAIDSRRRIRRVVVTAASPRRADTVVHGRRTAGKRSEIGRPRRRHLISSEYFRAMGIPLVKGRVHGQDTYTSPPVVIVSETLARQQFPDEDPIGRRIRINERSGMTCCVTAGPVENVWREIVGVARDIRQANLDEPPAATMYRPCAQIFEHDMFLMVRTRIDRDMPAVAVALAAELRQVDPAMEWWEVRPMHQVIAESGAIRARRFVVRLLGAFAALVLRFGGNRVVCEVMAWLIERRREIAVRMALERRGLWSSSRFSEAFGCLPWGSSPGRSRGKCSPG